MTVDEMIIELQLLSKQGHGKVTVVKEDAWLHPHVAEIKLEKELNRYTDNGDFIEKGTFVGLTIVSSLRILRFPHRITN